MRQVTAHRNRLPAGGQHRQLRTRVEERHDRVAAGIQQVLAVVQQQKDFPITDETLHRLDQ
jgi:hypothetical protein